MKLTTFSMIWAVLYIGFGLISLKQISMCLQKEWKLEEKKTIYTNSFTTERKNSRFYQVQRGHVFNVPDTTPGLDDPFYVK